MLDIKNARVYVDREGKTYPAGSDVAHFQTLVFGLVNTAVAGGRPLMREASDALVRAGWDGTALTLDDLDKLCRYQDVNGRSFAGTIINAYPEYDAILGNEPGGEAPAPQPAPSDEYLFESLFPVGHELSAKLPKGSKARRAVGAFENLWGFARHFWELAAAEGVQGVEALLKPARDAALVLYNYTIEAWQNGQDTITGAELVECQAAMDNYWNAMHAARAKVVAMKQTGFRMYPGDPRKPIFRYSLINRLAWRALSNMTTAAGLYGLRGEVMANGQREAEYVNAFESFDQQDPLRPQVLGSGGIHISDQMPG